MRNINDIPRSFKIANQTIKVEIVDSLEEDNYGEWDNAESTIRIAKTVYDTELSDEQLLNTFYHELFHSFQFFLNNEVDETQAQVYANFMREFDSTKQL